ncbi:S-locus lectin protein kinase family protein [Striga asiatica]|uniref:S-locus lectin protein kinase family protein n=1 Tax=Striga asiatica TaxID=4170 RepID=A0A5A7QKH0_STRAF|nr:S-locus lectin protein kinase family protein [Striga asiatica]
MRAATRLVVQIHIPQGSKHRNMGHGFRYHKDRDHIRDATRGQTRPQLLIRNVQNMGQDWVLEKEAPQEAVPTFESGGPSSLPDQTKNARSEGIEGERGWNTVSRRHMNKGKAQMTVTNHGKDQVARKEATTGDKQMLEREGTQSHNLERVSSIGTKLYTTQIKKELYTGKPPDGLHLIDGPFSDSNSSYRAGLSLSTASNLKVLLGVPSIGRRTYAGDRLGEVRICVEERCSGPSILLSPGERNELLESNCLCLLGGWDVE